MEPPRLLFEALPPDRGATPAQRRRQVDALAPLADVGVTAVNIPEIVNGHYETVAPRAFGAALRDAYGVRPIVNRITVHHALDDQRAWVQETQRDYGIDDLLFVGGERSSAAYPGPALHEALPVLARDVHAEGGSVGVVTIPTRRRPDLDEPDRLARKRAAGADYAVSQILMEPGPALRLMDDVAASAPGADRLPIVWSLAPVVRRKDIAFLEWLGVEFPAEVRRALQDADASGARQRRALEVATGTAGAILAHARDTGHGPVGFCVEHVMASNVEPALEMLEAVRDEMRAA